MAPLRELSFEQRVRIVLLDEEGVSERKIAERMKISKSSQYNQAFQGNWPIL